MMNYSIVEKAPFTIVGIRRPFHSDSSYQEIPKFWDEWLAQGESRPVMGTFGVCIDSEGKNFDYWIADLYFPWEEIPAGCEIAILCIPSGAQEIVNELHDLGVKGIVNFTREHFVLPEGMIKTDVDVVSVIEELVFEVNSLNK